MSTTIKSSEIRSHSINSKLPRPPRLTLIGFPYSTSKKNSNNTSLNKLNSMQTAHGRGSLLIKKNNQFKIEGELCTMINHNTAEISRNLYNNPLYIMQNSGKKGTLNMNEKKIARPFPQNQVQLVKNSNNSSKTNSHNNSYALVNIKQPMFNPFANKLPKEIKNEKQNLKSKSFNHQKSNRDSVNISHLSQSKLNDSSISLAYAEISHRGINNHNSKARIGLSINTQSRSLTPNPKRNCMLNKDRLTSKVKPSPIKSHMNRNPFDHAIIRQFNDFKNNKGVQPIIYSFYVKRVQNIKLVLNSGVKTKKPKTVITGTLSNVNQLGSTSGDISTNSTFISRIENKEGSSPISAKVSIEEKNTNEGISVNMGHNNPNEEVNKKKIRERKNLHKEKENRENLDFRQLETSPLLLRKKIIDVPEEEHINQIAEDTLLKQTNLKAISQNIKIASPGSGHHEKQPIKKKLKLMHEFTKIGFSGNGVKKVNQDIYFVFKNFVGNPNHIYMAVCDGHGIFGHEVSAFLKENLPVDLNNAMKAKNKNILLHSINGIIDDVFMETNFKLCTNEMIDSTFSGSTCVSLIYTPQKLICANVGDSRAVLGKCINGEWVSRNLSRDHKPSERDESLRIKRKGGRIEPFKDEDNEYFGPLRVWLKEDDIPGLAMTRSFGDRVASTVGVICDPEITEYQFADEDKFFIVASDGVWEFIDSKECVNIIKDFYLANDIVGCCEYLYKESCVRWIKEEEVIDDITMILGFLE